MYYILRTSVQRDQAAGPNHPEGLPRRLYLRRHSTKPSGLNTFSILRPEPPYYYGKPLLKGPQIREQGLKQTTDKEGSLRDLS